MQSGRKSQPSQRQLRVGESVRHALAEILMRGDIDDPDLNGAIISIAEVRMSADMRHAVVWAMPMGSEDPQVAIDALNRNARYIRGRIAPALRHMKYQPDLKFRLDTRFEDDSRVDALLRSPQVARDLNRDDSDGEIR